jgi:hypothetical protein
MFLSLVLVLTAICAGTLLTYLYDPDQPLPARLCAGACIGLALFGLIGFAWASMLGLNVASISITVACLAAAFLLLRLPELRMSIQRDLERSVRRSGQFLSHPAAPEMRAVICYVIAAILLAIFFSHAMFERAGAISTSAINNYGDLPFHVGIVTSFAYGENFPPEHPEFAGAPLIYPFIADFIAAVFLRAGASLTSAIFIENFILAIALVGLLHFWSWKLTQNRLAAALSPFLILLSGGCGWWLLADDVRRSHGIWGALTHLSHEYTTERYYGLRFGNLLETILLPQRSFLLGLPLAILIFTLWWQALNESGDNIRGRQMLAAGTFAGLMPLIHSHSFLVVMTMAAFLALIFWSPRNWFVFFAIALLLAVPQIFWSAYGSGLHTGWFLKWLPGWDKGNDPWWWFWLKNTGAFIPLLLMSILWRAKNPVVPRRLLLFSAPFALCFVAANLFNLAPFTWDNIKVLIYWYVASVPLVALLLARLWQSRFIPIRALALGLFISMITAGTLDVWRVLAGGSEWPIFTKDAVACADLVRQKCPPRALVLHAPTNDHPVFLTGRRSLIGVGAIVWSHGLEGGSREQDLKRIYSGQPNAEELLHRYGIDYIFLGPAERGTMQPNEHFLSRYSKIGTIDNCALYRVAAP